MFEVFGFYKFTKLKSLKKSKIILQKILIENNIKGTIIISKEGVNGTISGKLKDIKFIIKKINQIFKFKKFDSENNSKSNCQPFPARGEIHLYRQ